MADPEIPEQPYKPCLCCGEWHVRPGTFEEELDQANHCFMADLIEHQLAKEEDLW